MFNDYAKAERLRDISFLRFTANEIANICSDYDSIRIRIVEQSDHNRINHRGRKFLTDNLLFKRNYAEVSGLSGEAATNNKIDSE